MSETGGKVTTSKKDGDGNSHASGLNRQNRPASPLAQVRIGLTTS